MLLNVSKQTFHTPHVHMSQKVKGVLMWNLQHIIFIWRHRYWHIFIFTCTFKFLKMLRYIPYPKKRSRQKMKIFFDSDEFFCRLFFYRRLFLPMINFYRRIFLPTFFYKPNHLVFPNLKIPLVYLFDFKFY